MQNVFDSNVHPLFPQDLEASSDYLDELEVSLRKIGTFRALAVSLPGLNRHVSQEQFFEIFSTKHFFEPVWALSSLTEKDVAAEVARAIDFGSRLMKIHPRLLDTNLEDERIRMALLAIAESGMGSLLCTYPYGKSNGKNLHLPSILEATIPAESRVVLMHGGATQLLDVAEWARTKSDNLLIDLSWTIVSLHNSSVKFDIESLVRRFEERIVVGSDYPYIALGQFAKVLAGLEGPGLELSVKKAFGDNLNRFLLGLN